MAGGQKGATGKEGREEVSQGGRREARGEKGVPGTHYGGRGGGNPT